MLYIYTSILASDKICDLAIFYNIAYFIATLAVFSGLLLFTHLRINFLSDLQVLEHTPTMVFWFIIAIASMAGLPPFLGFWAKFLVLIGLWAHGEYLLTLHVLYVSLIFMYFYFAMYRFAGTTNFKARLTMVLLTKPSAAHAVGLGAVLLYISPRYVTS